MSDQERQLSEDAAANLVHEMAQKQQIIALWRGPKVESLFVTYAAANQLHNLVPMEQNRIGSERHEQHDVYVNPDDLLAFVGPERFRKLVNEMEPVHLVVPQPKNPTGAQLVHEGFAVSAEQRKR